MFTHCVAISHCVHASAAEDITEHREKNMWMLFEFYSSPSPAVERVLWQRPLVIRGLTLISAPAMFWNSKSASSKGIILSNAPQLLGFLWNPQKKIFCEFCMFLLCFIIYSVFNSGILDVLCARVFTLAPFLVIFSMVLLSILQLCRKNCDGD